MASRSIDVLHPKAQEKCKAWLAECAKEGIEVLIYCTNRTVEEQDALYAQGRTKPGNKVTNAKGRQSYHNFRVAWDCVPLVNGKPGWDRTDLYLKMAQIAEKLGIEWAGRWKSFKEMAHFQFTGGLTLADFQAGKTL